MDIERELKKRFENAQWHFEKGYITKHEFACICKWLLDCLEAGEIAGGPVL